MSNSDTKPLSKRAASKAATGAKVLAAAIELFDERSYEHTTIRDIAERAGFSTGAFFTSFAGKNDVFAHILKERFAARKDALENATVGLSGHAALLALAKVEYQHLGTPDFVRNRLMMRWSRGVVAEQLARERDFLYLRLYEALQSKYVTTLTFDPIQLGELIVSLIENGLGDYVMKQKSSEQLLHTFGTQLDMLLYQSFTSERKEVFKVA